MLLFFYSPFCHAPCLFTLSFARLKRTRTHTHIYIISLLTFMYANTFTHLHRLFHEGYLVTTDLEWIFSILERLGGQQVLLPESRGWEKVYEARYKESSHAIASDLADLFLKSIFRYM